MLLFFLPRLLFSASSYVRYPPELFQEHPHFFKIISFIQTHASCTELNNRKIGFKSIQENIDTTTSGGKLVFHIFGALAEFERDIIRERTQAGLTAARARGRLGGRPKVKALNTAKKITLAQSLYNDKNNTVDEICKTLNSSRATLYRYIKVK
jgi:DNA invertase Pin-like site-specific DNA recombinase